MNSLIISLIISYDGYIYESAGTISGFFDDPEHARSCASSVRSRLGLEVQVCGCGLAVAL